MEKITYKGVVIHLHEKEYTRHHAGSPGGITKIKSWKACTNYGWIPNDDFEEKDKEKTISRIKAFIDSVDMLIARTDEQLADYLKESICNGHDGSVIHPVLMKMVLGNARIPVKPSTTTHEPPNLTNKPWWVRIKDWIENWNRKATPNVRQSTAYFR